MSVLCKLLCVQLAIINAQSEEMFYSYDCGSQLDWIQDIGMYDPDLGHIYTPIQWRTSTRCPQAAAGNADSICLQTGADASISRVISTVGFHSVHLQIDVKADGVEVAANEWCIIQYRTSSTSWINTNIIRDSDYVLDYDVFIPDNDVYNNQESFEVKIGIVGSGGGDNCYFDNLKIFGIPYSYTETPTKNPSRAPLFEPTFYPTKDPSNVPTVKPTSHPSNVPTSDPSTNPTKPPTVSPTLPPVQASVSPTFNPTMNPSTNPAEPSSAPTSIPTILDTNHPTKNPSRAPLVESTLYTSNVPSSQSTSHSTLLPFVDTTTVHSLSPLYAPITQTEAETEAEAEAESQSTQNTLRFIDSEDYALETNNILMLIVIVIISIIVLCITCFVVRHCSKQRSTMNIINGISHYLNNNSDIVHESMDEKPKVNVDNETNDELRSWLTNCVQLPQYYSCFVDHGYDDLSSIKNRIEDESKLESIGITFIGHRARIFALIKLLQNETVSDHVTKQKGTTKGTKQGEEDADEEHKEGSGGYEIALWLRTIVGLSQYYPQFINNGYGSVEFMKKITEISQLKDIGIESVKHQQHIMFHIELLKKNEMHMDGFDDDSSHESMYDDYNEGVEAITKGTDNGINGSGDKTEFEGNDMIELQTCTGNTGTTSGNMTNTDNGGEADAVKNICTYCGLMKVGKVYASDGLFYCNECWQWYSA